MKYQGMQVYFTLLRVTRAGEEVEFTVGFVTYPTGDRVIAHISAGESSDLTEFLRDSVVVELDEALQENLREKPSTNSERLP